MLVKCQLYTYIYVLNHILLPLANLSNPYHLFLYEWCWWCVKKDTYTHTQRCINFAVKSKNLYAITNGDSERRGRERKKIGNWHSCAQPVNECNTQCLHINRANTTAIDAIQIFAARACTRLHSSKIRVNKNAICIWLY